MAITRVQVGAAGVTSTGTGTVTPTLPGAVTAGSLVVIVAAQKTVGGAATINTPSGWTQADQLAPQVSNVTAAIFYVENATGGLTLPAVTGSQDMYAYALEYSGVAASGSLDVHATSVNAGSVATLTTGTSPSTDQPAELLVGIICNPNTTTTTGDAFGGSATGGSVAKLGEATSGNATAGSKVTARAYEYIATGDGTAEFHGSVSPNRSYAGVVATFGVTSSAGLQIGLAERFAPVPFVPRGRNL